VPAPSYWCLVVNTVTGVVLDELPISDFTWNDSLDLDRPGSMTVTVPLLDDSPTSDASQRVKARSVASAPWLTTLCLVRNGRALWAGPVVTYSASANTVQFGCVSVAKLLDARLLVANGFELTPTATGADVTITSNQAATAVTLLNLATTGTGCALPFTISPVSTTGDLSRVYAAADTASVLSRLAQLTQESGGPDVRFTAVLDQAQSALTWHVDVGQPRLGDVTAPWVWDYPASILEATEDGDGSDMTFRGYVPGDSSSAGTRPIGVAEYLTPVSAGFPMLERVSRDTASVREQILLDRQATSYVAANITPALTWKVTVDPEMWPEIGTWNFGDNARLVVAGHNWIPDGDYTHRVIGVTHTPNSAELETSPALEAI
jgi:hypothetical protein